MWLGSLLQIYRTKLCLRLNFCKSIRLHVWQFDLRVVPPVLGMPITCGPVTWSQAAWVNDGLGPFTVCLWTTIGHTDHLSYEKINRGATFLVEKGTKFQLGVASLAHHFAVAKLYGSVNQIKAGWTENGEGLGDRAIYSVSCFNNMMSNRSCIWFDCIDIASLMDENGSNVSKVALQLNFSFSNHEIY